MLFIISALGIVGACVIGLDGLMLGSAGELERIAAIACMALAAAGFVGLMADDGSRARTSTLRRLELGGYAFQWIAAAPILALSVGVFLATLLPAIYVMLPFFAVWWYGSPERRPVAARAPAPTVRGGRPLQVPAYP